MSDSKQAFPLIAVEVIRDKNTHLTVDVPEHEIAVLRAIHGDEHVKAMGPTGGAEDPEFIELVPDINAEWDRLNRKYRRINAPNPVEAAFPSGKDALAKLGFGTVAGAAGDKPPASMVVKHKPEKPKAEPAKK